MQILVLSLVLDCVNVSMGAFYLFPKVHKLQNVVFLTYQTKRWSLRIYGKENRPLFSSRLKEERKALMKVRGFPVLGILRGYDNHNLRRN
jgi:hypothetical protein